MTNTIDVVSGRGATWSALLWANLRFWGRVEPQVRVELRRWTALAQAIPDRQLRELALGKLRHERFNAEVAATLATLACPRHRRATVRAIVALQVLYDYLDGLNEASEGDVLGDGAQLYQALSDAVTFPAVAETRDYLRLHARSDDGGYIEVLMATSRTALVDLPAFDAVCRVAQSAARRCGEAQTRVHAIDAEGVEQLRDWALAAEDRSDLTWWEYAAGAAASVLSLHALIAEAADPTLTPQEAARIDAAYLATCAMSTLLDSLVDAEHDDAADTHSFIAYYPTPAAAAERLGVVAAVACERAGSLRNPGHHAMTSAGVAGYYLSAVDSSDLRGRTIKRVVRREFGPVMTAVLGIFGAWRALKASADWLERMA